jgi:uncharacterized protein YjeT (DUF2065 family)
MIPSSSSAVETAQIQSVWHYKPWWCQPWSILLTGCSLIGGSGWLSHRLWVALIVAVPVMVWMGFFLLIYPQAWKNQMAAAARQESESFDKEGA